MSPHHVRVLGLVSTVAAMSVASLASAQVGTRSPSERQVVEDEETGADLVVLTDGEHDDVKIYQTHPQWSADGEWVIFRSDGRSEDGQQAYAVHEETGDIVQVTEGSGTDAGSLNVAQKSMKLYYLRRPSGGDATGPIEMIEVELGQLLEDAMSDQVDPDGYERVIGELPEGMRPAGGFGLDADENVAYLGASGGDVGEYLPEGVEPVDTPEGARMGAGPGGIRAMDLETGEVSVVVDVPFQMGHVQANPWTPGEVLFCWETGGDASQRMFITTRENGEWGYRPLFEEGPLDWVTHEVYTGPNEVMFNLIGHQPRLRVRPTGIATVDTRTDAVDVIDQIVETGDVRTDLGVNAAGPESYGGYWHCNGSHDGRWVVGDTFQGDLYVIDRESGERFLASTDHKMEPQHAHPTFHPDSDRILINSGKFSDGERVQLVVVPVPEAAME